MTEPNFSVTFTKGFRVGARSTRFVYVVAENHADAERKAMKEWPEYKKLGFRVTDSHDMSRWGGSE